MPEEATPVEETPVEPVAPATPAALGDTPVTAPTPSFQINDTEAFAAAAPEGYDTKAALELMQRHKGDMHSILKHLSESEKAFSSRIPIPDPSDPAKMAEIQEKLGVPKEPTGYQWSEGIQFKSDEAKAEMGGLFKEAGVSSEGANKLLSWYQNQQESTEQTSIQQINDGIVETELHLQERSGGLKGTQAYDDYFRMVKGTLASKGIDISDPENSALLGSDVGRKIIDFAYEYGISGRGGKIPGTESVTTVHDVDQRFNELNTKLMKDPNNKDIQRELYGVLEQKKRLTKNN